ncbi:MAG: aspartate--tRNA ligase [bacterium]|jgi:aspartyl-tRNA synthetase
MSAQIGAESGGGTAWTRSPANLAELLRTDADGREVVAMGWVDARRDLGALVFVWLRDRYLQELQPEAQRRGYEAAKVQVTFNPEYAPDAHRLAEQLRGEYVVAVRGEWRMRADKDVNPKLLGGDREIFATGLKILSPAETPPFYIAEDPKAGEDLRMQYRYLDLRRRPLVEALAARHRIFLSMRNALSEMGFLEVETPMLGRSTPEGARDYLVPSRVFPGKFYALPQSPQLLKQLLMVGGIDRYFQMARCFRDEDLRANRQPEFTQLDLEMSFASRDELFSVGEKMFEVVFREVLGQEIETPFPRIPFDEAMARWGSDKPDLRFGCEIIDLSDMFVESEFGVFKSALDAGGAVKGLFVPGYAPSRKEIDELTEFAKKTGAGGLAYAKAAGGVIEKTSFDKFATDAEKSALAELASGDGVFLIAAGAPAREKVEKTLGLIRVKLAKELGLIKEGAAGGGWKFAWIVDFPLYDRNPETGALEPAHHPFTMPHPEFTEEYEPGRFRLKANTDEEKLAIRADNYDLVLNGEELGSGSHRIHDPVLQRSVLAGLGMSEAEIEEQFGFFLNAFSYGAPPHRGFAFGMDRIVMLMFGFQSIRDVIAFPKTAQASDLMTKAPAEVGERQLGELGIRLSQQ